MTNVFFDSKELVMEIQGHAGFANAGQDIVCAAVSALSMTLLAAAEEEPMYQASRDINKQEALIRVSCCPERGYMTRCREMFRTICIGFELLHMEYPGFVRIEVSECS